MSRPGRWLAEQVVEPIVWRLIWATHGLFRHRTMPTKDPRVAWCPDCLTLRKERKG